MTEQLIEDETHGSGMATPKLLPKQPTQAILVEQEPVAMLFNLSGKRGATTAKEYALDIDPSAVPLYTQPQRKSLGYAALSDIIERTDGMSLVDILIEVEKAHGIGV
jgi:hypothetical protein